jgi:DNA-directed RNA polymerase subunit RPC12/RpoP
MTVDINCAKCGEKICTLRMLKSIKDILKTYNNKCPHCRQRLSTTDFTLNTEKK